MNIEQLKEKYPAGERRWPVVITEVTRMSKGFYCVAAFDIHAGRMIRPLQQPSSNWRLANRDIFAPGNLVVCDYTGVRGSGAYPHRTEDTVLARMPELLEVLRPEDVQNVLGASLHGSIAEVYDRQLMEDKYVNDGTRCASLGGIAVPIQNLEFEESFGKLRLRIRDNDGKHYSLAVTSDDLRTRFHDNPADPPAIQQANEWLAGFRRDSATILRLGLARAWDGKEQKYNPKRCFLQCNGIILSSS